MKITSLASKRNNVKHRHNQRKLKSSITDVFLKRFQLQALLYNLKLSGNRQACLMDLNSSFHRILALATPDKAKTMQENSSTKVSEGKTP